MTEMNKNYEALLAGALPIDENAKFDFTPSFFKKKEGLPKEYYPVYKLESFSNEEKDKAYRLLLNLEKDKEKAKDFISTKGKITSLCCPKVVDWEIKISEDNDIKFEKDKVKNIPWPTMELIFDYLCFVSGIKAKYIEDAAEEWEEKEMEYIERTRKDITIENLHRILSWHKNLSVNYKKDIIDTEFERKIIEIIENKKKEPVDVIEEGLE